MKTQYGKMVQNNGTNMELGKVYRVREVQHPRKPEYFEVNIDEKWVYGWWKHRFELVPRPLPTPLTPPKSKYVQLRLKRNTSYWVCGEDGQPNAATKAEIKAQTDAIWHFLHHKLPQWIVDDVKRRILVS